MIQDPREAAKYLLTLFGLAALITIVVLAASTLGHATTTQHRNSLGVPMYTVNPYIYEAGEIVDYAIVEKGEGLSIRVKPLATYMLFDDNLLLCGVPADKINGHENPMVLVYERVSHKLVAGIGCHELVEVRSIKAEKPE